MTPGEERAGRRWLAAWRLARALPEPVAMLLGAVGGRVYQRLDGSSREALRANLAQVLGPQASPRAREKAVRRAFASYARYWVEAFRLEDLGADEIRRRLVIDGREHLDAAVAGGRGVVFATPHLGNWDAGGAWLAASGYPVAAVVERLRPAAVFERYLDYRRALGLEIIPLDGHNGGGTLRVALRVLREGRMVCLVCDRDLTGGGLPVRLFGRETTMPGGPASLARRTGAPILPCAVYQDEHPNHWRAVVRPPLHAEPGGDARAGNLALTQRLAGEFERLIRHAPEQWHVLRPVWGRPAA